MNQRIDFNKDHGLFVYQDTLDFLQQSYRNAFGALATAFGTKLILYGVQVIGGNVSDGWVVIDGEMMPFVGGPSAPNVLVEEIPGDELFADGSTQTVYYTKRAKLVNAGGFAFTDLRPFKTDLITVDDSNVLASSKTIKKLLDQVLALVGFENEIILSGCTVSNINTITSNFDVAAGSVKFGSVIIATPAYSGSYPAYLKEDASWVTALPGAGSFIKFDPYTSQRYADVLKRATTPVGKIEMYKTDLTNRFDVAGVGKWEWLGFKICTDMQGRVPVGYDSRAVDPSDNVWDGAYNIIGGVGGEKKHTLGNDEQVAGVKPHAGAGGDIDGWIAHNPPGTDNYDLTRPAGNAVQPHENRAPFRVVLILERI
jgi:hypothetical protein